MKGFGKSCQIHLFYNNELEAVRCFILNFKYSTIDLLGFPLEKRGFIVFDYIFRIQRFR